MTELLSELRRSPVVGDREVAELLQSLQPADGRRPRASEVLAAFIAERGSGVTPPAELPPMAESSSLVVVLGGPADPKPVRHRRLTWVWAQVAAAAAVALVAVAVATSGPSRDVVVRPADSSDTVAPATAAPADTADPAPRRHHPVAPGAGSRPHLERIHSAATGPNVAPPVSTSAAASHDEASARDADDAAQPEESGDDRADETARGTDGGVDSSDGGDSSDGSDSSDGGGGDGRETPDGIDD
jgi:hypothetical protein